MLLLRLAFQRDLALELLAGDLATDQPGEGPDSRIGARGIVAARFRPYDLDADPVAFEAPSSPEIPCPEGAGTIEEPLAPER
ncbi:hypothetical protein [Paracoccus haematequi]|uniref:hypothetical protein n=1 Tax=Paracoccus haematequi TaxID=2491866 RepID=UPI0013E0E456|nr:hypothetical protein [Paracoccus haematequi]